MDNLNSRTEPAGSAEPRKPELNSLGIAKNWSVTVEAGGIRVLCISDQHYAGVSELEPYEPTIENAAKHLLAFIGSQQSAGSAGKMGEREAFEKFVSDQGVAANYLGDGQYGFGVQLAWDAWQARSALSQAQMAQTPTATAAGDLPVGVRAVLEDARYVAAIHHGTTADTDSDAYDISGKLPERIDSLLNRHTDCSAGGQSLLAAQDNRNNT